MYNIVKQIRTIKLQHAQTTHGNCIVEITLADIVVITAFPVTMRYQKLAFMFK